MLLHCRGAAHKLKGSIATLGGLQAVEAAAAMERAGREDDLTEATAVLHTLETALDELSAVLETLQMDRAA